MKQTKKSIIKHHYLAHVDTAESDHWILIPEIP